MSVFPLQQWYEPVDAALYRAATVLDTPAPPWWPDLDDQSGAEQMRRWITEAWSDAHTAEAITLASPSLAARISEVSAGRPVTPAQARSVVVSLARYLVRMSGRPTPFGLFAGVGALDFQGEPSAAWKPDRQWIRTRAHAVWLARIIGRLEAHAELRRRLPVTVNDLAYECGDRLIVPWQPHGTDPTQPPAAQVSLRLTPAVRIARQQAGSSLVLADLAGKIAAELPRLPAAAIEALLAHLAGHGLLITALRPPSTCRDGLTHVMDQLAAVNAETIPDLRPFLADLSDIAMLLAAGQPEAAARMRQLTDVEHPVTVDLRAGTRMVLPPIVAAEAAAATGALVRLTPHPDGAPGWRAYHEAFLARFGAHALVPVRMLIDPVAGLGYPAHFTEPDADLPPMLTSRDARLLRLAQHAALDGAQEVVVDEAFINALHDTEVLQVPPHLEMCAQLWAPSLDAVASGRFRLVVSSFSRTGAALAGRFIDLLAEPDRQRRHLAYTRLPSGVAEAITAQLSFPPIHAHLENVVRAPQLLPALISVAEHRPMVGEKPTGGDRLPLDDLAVTADNHGMYLVSLSRRQVVEPMLANAAARRVMPPMVRLLFEIPRARRAASSPFAWGAARCLPFLPRVVYGRTVLAMARWSLTPDRLPAAGLSDRQWRAEFEALRRRIRLPDTISVGDSDLRLRLALDEQMDLAVLRDYLDKARTAASTVMISEAGTTADHGWFGGRAHEIIVPVSSTRPCSPAPKVLARSGPLTTVRADRGVLPGTGRVLFAKLYGDPTVFDLILTEHLPTLLTALPADARWWFIRYRDPGAHLRIRLHTDDLGAAFTHIGAWARRLRGQGLTGDVVFDTHVPETARYGDGPAVEAVEALFAADSAAVVAQLTTLRADRKVPAMALTAAGHVDLVAGLNGGVEAGMRWLIDHPPVGPATAPGREIVRRAIQLTDPGGLAALPGGESIVRAWAARRAAAEAYRRHWKAASLEATSVIRSLLHMNHIRSVGIDPDSEHTAQRLARAVALAVRRPAGED
ncbi:lantibiotic dehydratase [Streptosporangium sandarakinum]|uniref:lantibiotic dehydratase n=1 Tax=Streptosporangium sandarakinum TaxID=1260955 RepID=UPI00339F870F